jgi:dihydropteroate synthase
MHWQTSRFILSLDRPLVMGIVNVSPDSFSSDGEHGGAEAAIAQCEQFVAEGADILDIGGVSTRPGSHPPGIEEELARVMPVLQHAVTLGVPVSVDTSDPRVMQAVLVAGADIINDVKALQRPGALEVLARSPAAGVCLMHMRGEPETMQTMTDYDDVVAEVRRFFVERLEAAARAGIAPERIVLDPGIGFAKTSEQNWLLLHRQSELVELGRPILVGWSRKSSLGKVTGRDVHHRLGASVTAALACVQRGATIVRVHDVADTVDAIKIWQAARLMPPSSE